MATDFWRDRSVFVTGATGSLGKWLVPALRQRGAHVTALVRAGSASHFLQNAHDSAPLRTVCGNLSDTDLLQRAFEESRVDTVFHLAAQTQVGAAKQDPIGTLEANVRGTWLLLEAARQTGVRAIVTASSDKAYGASERLPYREDDPLRGTFPYDVSKSCSDLIATMYARTYGLPVTMARCANLFGGGDLNTNRLIPGAILATLKGERFVIRSDGKFVRDFLYMEDAVRGFLLLAEALSASPELRGEAFNFGLGRRTTTLDLVHTITAMMGRPELLPEVQNVASGEIREQYMETSKASAQLQWRPEFSLEQGLERTIEWYKTHP